MVLETLRNRALREGAQSFPQPHEFAREDVLFSIKDLTVTYQNGLSKFVAVEGVTFDIPRSCITAIIGPSGSGKSTILRALDLMNHEFINGQTKGTILYNRISLDGGKETIVTHDLYGGQIDATSLRRSIGLIAQKPNPFPNMSIYGNVISGYTLNGIRKPPSNELHRDQRPLFAQVRDILSPRNLLSYIQNCEYSGVWDEFVKETLEKVGLLKEVADKLHEPASALSGGQQQRLCIARSVAVNPDVLLMDEPCSSLDHRSMSTIEELMWMLVNEGLTIVLVTHNLNEAVRVSDYTAVLYSIKYDSGLSEGVKCPGYLVEYNTTQQIFDNPQDKRTRDFINGRLS